MKAIAGCGSATLVVLQGGRGPERHPTEAQCFDVLLPAIFEVSEAQGSENGQNSPGKRVSREMQRYQERLRSTSAELARFQSPLVLDDPNLERPAPHLPAQVADPAHVHARERERTPEPRGTRARPA